MTGFMSKIVVATSMRRSLYLSLSLAFSNFVTVQCVPLVLMQERKELSQVYVYLMV